MIKVRKEDLIIFGLSDENMTRLKAGQPIKFQLRDLKLDPQKYDDYTIIIFSDKTEETMAASLNQMIQPLN